ncbi:MAG: hypothetical protein E4G98_02750 [Promethearchaeota archaeon]|nr:MAG: hypothetical protein E4G98_02750 [Candidatus Lokiarchaeota archaeon]
MPDISLIIQSDAEDTDCAEIFVEGKMGDKNCQFLLDTGAARTHVKLDDLTATYDRIHTDNSSGVFSKSKYDFITITNIEFGPIIKSNFTIARYTEKNSDYRNLIGMDILKEFRCRFLFDENRISVDDPENIGTDDTLHDLFLGKKFHPYVTIQLGQMTWNTVWDTGAGITVVDMDIIKKFPEFFQEMGHSLGTDSSGTTMDTPLFIMAASKIGDKGFPPQKVAGVDLSQVNSTTEVPMDMILGYTTLSKANWLFDFPRQKWAVLEILKVL